jgi:hypothetical protein
MSTIRKKFVRDVKTFLKDYKDLKPYQFGLDALGDPRFVADLDSKRSFGTSTIEKVYRHMEGYRKKHPLAETAGAD